MLLIEQYTSQLRNLEDKSLKNKFFADGCLYYFFFELKTNNSDTKDEN